jgi:hypothetical protein
MMDRRPSRIAYILPLVLLLAAGADARRISAFDGTDERYRAFTDRIKTFLMKGLVSERHLPHAINERLPDRSSVAYVLGGTQESLGYKWKTVGRLYARGTVGNILILHRPGITEYSPMLGRNLTNDEWAIGKLKEEGVAAEAVEFVSVPPATFDTFAEARVISALARSRQVTGLVLVTSMHHTERVRISFSYFDADNAFECYLYGSEERARIMELLRENMTLRIYRYFLLPIDRLLGVQTVRRMTENDTTSPISNFRSTRSTCYES